MEEIAATPDVEIGAGGGFELAEVGDEVGGAEGLGVGPVEFFKGAGGDVFGRAVEGLADRVVVVVRPVAGEDIVGAATEEHGELAGDGLADGAADGFLAAAHGPAAVGEAVTGVFVGAAGGLHDAVVGEVGEDDELAHGGKSEIGDGDGRWEIGVQKEGNANLR